MSFLQPAMLFAIPIIALPIIIHLINQRRFQTVQWAAMNFLLAANRMSRGYARIRQWLILAARTLAIAGLVFAIARPLASGWLGLTAGSRVDTTIILLDRSASMNQLGPGGQSKLESGVDQLVRSLNLLESNRYVLIDSVNQKAVEIESPDVLSDLQEATSVSASADIPTMLETADQYIRANRPSRCEVWICSDIRRNDWKDDSGRWQAIRASLQELPQMVRYHLLAYANTESNNRSLRVSDVRRVEEDGIAKLLLSIKIEQLEPVEGTEVIPIKLNLNGATSEPFTAELTGTEVELKNLELELDEASKKGWGKISIPADAVPTDNEFYFTYDESVTRRTVIVSDDPDLVKPLELASSIPPSVDIRCLSQTLTPAQLVGVDWSDVSLVLWQSSLPKDDEVIASLNSYLERGGQAIFFPPQIPDSNSYAGLKWGAWQETDQRFQVATWVGDQDLLANTRSGASLPVGQMNVMRYCQLEGDKSSLATLDGGAPLLARALTDRRNVYFCTTTVLPTDSSMARDGVVMYAMVQRVLEAGAQSLGNAQRVDAGNLPRDHANQWKRLIGSEEAMSSEFTFQAGVYEQEEKLIAVNRSQGEDVPAVVNPERLAGLFEGLDFDRVDDTVGSGTTLIQEIWRLFLVLMLIALILEAILCIPRRVTARDESPFASEGSQA